MAVEPFWYYFWKFNIFELSGGNIAFFWWNFWVFLFNQKYPSISAKRCAPSFGLINRVLYFTRAGPGPRECFCLTRKKLGFLGYIMFIFSGKLHGLSTGLRPLPHSFGRLCLKYEKSIKFTILCRHQNHPLKSLFQNKIQF